MPSARIILFAVVLAAAAVVNHASYAQNASKPRLADKIARVLEADGAEAAQARFDELFPSRKDEYNLDPEPLAKPGAEYMQNGDMETARTVLGVATTIAQAQVEGLLSDMPRANDAENANNPEETPEPESEDTEPTVEQPEVDRGLQRDDLDRFRGLYADPEQPDNIQRTLFVTMTCSGYLEIGPMWADVANWFMRSVSDNVFEHDGRSTSFSVEFADDRMIHTMDFLPSPLVRTGPLPDGWGDCIERELR